MTDSRTVEGDTYEMFWDCKFCRTPKLLGLTHRHCPVCGAPQNAAERYFPDDSEKVRVQDHQYVGRDLVCRHCATYNSRNSTYCRDCGAPTSEAAEAQVQGEGNAPQAVSLLAQKLAPAATRPSRGWGLVKLVLLALVAIGCLFFFWKKEESFSVVGRDWERRIEIERLGPVRDSAWCDQLPSTARELRRYRAVRSHEQIPDGETCTTRKVDQGDGTFREVKDCKPRYKTRDIEDNRCDFEVNRWSPHRFVESKGQSTNPAPSWPALDLVKACSAVGCERSGARRETYRVQLQGAGGTEICEVSLTQWSSMNTGQRLGAKVRVLGGGIDCGSLKAM